MLERALAVEVDEFLGRPRYERRMLAEHGYRNGYGRPRAVAIGTSRPAAWVMLAGALLGALNTLGILSLPGPLRGPALGGTGFEWLGVSVMQRAGDPSHG